MSAYLPSLLYNTLCRIRRCLVRARPRHLLELRAQLVFVRTPSVLGEEARTRHPDPHHKQLRHTGHTRMSRRESAWDTRARSTARAGRIRVLTSVSSSHH